jgi:hypothetical protein
LKRPEEFHEKTKTKNLSTIWTAFPIKSIYIYVTIAFSFANAHEFPKFVSKCSLRLDELHIDHHHLFLHLDNNVQKMGEIEYMYLIVFWSNT